MIKIIKITEKNKNEADRFDIAQWQKLSLKLFGYQATFNNDEYANYGFKATINDQIVGVIWVSIELGVMLIDDLMILDEYRGYGIGSKLLEKVCTLKEKHNLHKIILFTGVDWPSNEFYLKHGFAKVTELKNHFLHKDFVLYEKLI